jgi:TetR/AcrR family transcriptional regulator, tetracycline repressor protein
MAMIEAKVSRVALTQQEVVTTAIRLLDEVGLDGLTLRRLATELGISAPTLYWHVSDKRHLLDLMADAMVGSYHQTLPPLPPDLEWWEKIAEVMRRQYQALLAHRDGARVVAGNRPTQAMLPRIESMLELWQSIGFEPAEALTTALSFGNYIVGSALEYQAEMERERQVSDEVREALLDQNNPYPRLREASLALRGSQRHDSFEHGLSLMVAGLRRRQADLADSPGTDAKGQKQKAGHMSDP